MAIKAAVIGGGPGGLTALKTLSENGIDAQLFEAEERVGGTFRYRSYQNADLVSSKQLTTFSDFRLPRNSPDHISLPEYCRYLEDYCDHFRLWRRIKLRCRVLRVEATGDATLRHRVVYEEGGEQASADFTHLVICSGLHVEPNIPKIPGIEHLKGKAIHSSEYKERKQLEGQDVLLLGCGETSMDLAYESMMGGAKSATMSFRTGFLSFPKVLKDFRVFHFFDFEGTLPIDGLITNLLETAYVHPAVAQSRIRWFISDFVIKRVLFFLTGTQEGCNQHVGQLPPDRLGRAFVFLNKSSKAMPYLNRPFFRRHWLLRLMGNEYIDSPEDASSDKFVATMTWPSRILPSGEVEFEPSEKRKDYLHWRKAGLRVKPSLLVYCTGYEQRFDWLPESYPRPSDAVCRNIVAPRDPTIAFLGFVRPTVGAIPPIAEQQALWYTAHLLGYMPKLPTTPSHYNILSPDGARIAYGVDHGGYVSQLGRDFGGAPSLLELWQVYGITTLFTYAFGASFVAFYRLTGPFRFEGVQEVVEGELLHETVLRRGILGNLFFGLIPMLFYAVINGAACVLDFCGLLPQLRAR